ncbi:MAG: hypothetical protein NTZ17_01365 [Phycisphaerae bacterium]|nr:hypothetical protein [Phycisphaerae bacterium]
MPEGGGYPVLAIFNGYTSLKLQGQGTAEDPYLISNAWGLGAMVYYSPDAHYRLAASIDLTGIRWGMAAIPRFGGTFDGAGHTISHLTITGGSYLGLFGQVVGKAEVKNLGVVDVSITGSGHDVGGLMGSGWNDWPRPNVIQCYSTGTVTGTYSVGGLAGSGDNLTRCYSTAAVSGTEVFVGGLVGSGGNLTQCYSTGAVSGHWEVGGLVGSGGNLTRCYSTGRVSGESTVGGLVGIHGGALHQCYSTGMVSGNTQVGGLIGDVPPLWDSTVTACFWDTQTSGQAKSTGGTGKTTAQMHTAKTFLDGGWDFVGETANGTEDTWWILEGKEYPGLAWEFWACSPDPANGAADVIQPATLTWGAARRAVTHDVYFGEDETAVANATRASLGIYRGRQKMEMAAYDPGVLDWGKIYYWRIDEVNEADPDSPWKGRVWSFTTTDCITSPGPANHAIDVIQQTILSWVPGGPGLQYDMYLGKDKDAVASATPGSPGIYRSRQPPGTTTYDPGILEWGTTYYWRIDGVAEADPRSPWKGSVWSFTTVDFVVSVVDDFESYTNDINLVAGMLFSTWIPGFLNGTGGGFLFAEQTILHGGKQSLPMDYNNVKKPWYSEAQRTWATAQDWTAGGADTLTLYFRGETHNARDPLYVGVEDSAGRIAVVVHPDTGAVLATEWQKWHIALADVRAAGVDVAAVKKMVIGVGDRKNPKPGGTGRIYIDDIRLTKRMP